MQDTSDFVKTVVPACPLPAGAGPEGRVKASTPTPTKQLKK